MINSEDLETELERAKKDGVEYQTEDDRALLRSWEQQLQDIKASASFLEHQETRKLHEVVVREILRINARLTNEHGLETSTREALFETRDFAEKLKSFLERDPEKSMDALEQDIKAHTFSENEDDA